MRKKDTPEALFDASEERIHLREGRWYFDTREGPRGPFWSKPAAELELSNYVETMSFLDERREELPKNLDFEDVTLVSINREPDLF
ncbi:MAG: DUF6316 family protein [Pseudomonadota bacterium]